MNGTGKFLLAGCCSTCRCSVGNVGMNPEIPLEGNHPLDGFFRGHSMSHVPFRNGTGQQVFGAIHSRSGSLSPGPGVWRLGLCPSALKFSGLGKGQTSALEPGRPKKTWARLWIQMTYICILPGTQSEAENRIWPNSH